MPKGPYPLEPRTIGRRESADSRRATESVVKYKTCLIRIVGRLYGESANDYGESADDYGESADDHKMLILTHRFLRNRRQNRLILPPILIAQ